MSTLTATGKYIEVIEAQRVRLANREYVLNNAQQNCLDKVTELLGEDEQSLQNRSSQQRGRRIRVRNFLRNTIQNLGPEPAFLCIVSISITDLAAIQYLLQRPLSSWWKKVEKSKSLHDLAVEALQQYVSATDITGPIMPLVNEPAVSRSHALSMAAVTSRKRRLREVDEPALEQPTARSSACEQSRHGDNEGADNGDANGDKGKLTGNVYQLTALDAIQIVVTDAKAAQNILLTVPVYQETSSFITISVSDVSAMQLLTRRRQLM